MPTFDLMVAEVENAQLLLAKPIVMLAGGRMEGGGNAVPGVRFLLLRCVASRCLSFIRNHGPSPHRQQWFARCVRYEDCVVVRSTARVSVEVVVPQGPIQLVERHCLRWRQ